MVVEARVLNKDIIQKISQYESIGVFRDSLYSYNVVDSLFMRPTGAILAISLLLKTKFRNEFFCSFAAATKYYKVHNEH